jgi:hypothetical protein
VDRGAAHPPEALREVPAFSRNLVRIAPERCPYSSGTLSALARNRCPFSAGLRSKHAKVEDWARQSKATGLDNFPCEAMAENKAWLEVAMVAADLVCWSKLICSPTSRRSPAARSKRSVTRSCTWLGS